MRLSFQQTLATPRSSNQYINSQTQINLRKPHVTNNYGIWLQVQKYRQCDRTEITQVQQALWKPFAWRSSPNWTTSRAKLRMAAESYRDLVCLPIFTVKRPSNHYTQSRNSLANMRTLWCEGCWLHDERLSTTKRGPTFFGNGGYKALSKGNVDNRFCSRHFRAGLKHNIHNENEIDKM